MPVFCYVAGMPKPDIQSMEECLTFDDVSLIPAYSEILPSQVDLRTSLSPYIELHAPLISAAMDTVTEHATAIAMAQSGGLGIIHKNMDSARQAEEVALVKRFEAAVVRHPLTVTPEQTIGEAISLMAAHRVSGFPVLSQGKVCGIVTKRDLRTAENLLAPIASVMTRKPICATSDTSTDKCRALMHEHRIEKLPLVSKEGKLEGLVTIKDLQKASTFSLAARDAQDRLLCGAAVGPSVDLEERAHLLVEAGADILAVDTAHGHSKSVIAAVKKLRDWFPSLSIWAGNIVTGEAADALADAGADVVKVGVGPGSICTTRIIAGVGVPQISAIFDVAKVTKRRGLGLVSDGGIKFSGDIVKALAAGAQAVMAGSLFAGTEEAPGERVLYQGRAFKVYRGMGSMGSMSRGSKDRYGQSDVEDMEKLVPQGIEGRIPFRGPLSATVHQLLGGIRAGLGYMGAKNIVELAKKSRFIRITNAGLRESHVHDVIITKEAPNYYMQSS